MLKAAGEGDWRSFAATATALLDGAPLESIPFMERILGTSHAAFWAPATPPGTLRKMAFPGAARRMGPGPLTRNESCRR